jgi:uncharacterized protein (UPF0335 family)
MTGWQSKRKLTDREGNMENETKNQLLSFIERIERMEEEKAAVATDIKEIYAEAKNNGFETKIIRKIVSLRRKSKEERQEEEALLETYMSSIGM